MQVKLNGDISGLGHYSTKSGVWLEIFKCFTPFFLLKCDDETITPHNREGIFLQSEILLLCYGMIYCIMKDLHTHHMARVNLHWVRVSAGWIFSRQKQIGIWWWQFANHFTLSCPVSWLNTVLLETCFLLRSCPSNKDWVKFSWGLDLHYMQLN